MVSDPFMNWLHRHQPEIFIWIGQKKYNLALVLEDVAGWIKRI